MRKALVVLALAVVIAAATAVYVIRVSGIREPAALCPPETVVFLAAPDFRRTSERWPKTSLARIAAEPEFKAFLAKPLEALEARGAREARAILSALKPQRAFFAVTGIRRDGGDLLLGFQFAGSRKDVDSAFERMYAQLESAAPPASREASIHEGDRITKFVSGKYTLVSAVHGNWAFLSNREEALTAALDRAARRVKSPGFDAADGFKRIRENLSAAPDVVWVVQPQRFVDLLVEIGQSLKARPIEWQVEQLRKLEGLGGSLELDGSDLVETIYTRLAKGASLPAIDRQAMQFSTPQSAVLAEFGIDLSVLADRRYWETFPPAALEAMNALGLSPDAVAATLGGRAALVANWPAGSMIPGAVVALDIKDRDRAVALAQSLVGAFAPGATSTDVNGAKVFAFPALETQIANPRIAITPAFAIATSNSAEMDRLLAAKPGAPTLESSRAFEPAAAAYKDAGNAFAYVDTRAIFERVYNPLRPVAILAASMTPNASTFIDADKLPDTEIISKHLGPITFAQKAAPGGTIAVSRGPITLNQALVVLGAGVGASIGAQSMLAR